MTFPYYCPLPIIEPSTGPEFKQAESGQGGTLVRFANAA